MKKIFFILMLAMLLLPQISLAAGLVPCGGPGEPRCDFNQLMNMANILINFLLFKITLPIAAILFAYVGFLLLFQGESKRDTAKAIAWNVVLGLIIALAAWLIVKTVLLGLGLKPGYSLLEGLK